MRNENWKRRIVYYSKGTQDGCGEDTYPESKCKVLGAVSTMRGESGDLGERVIGVEGVEKKIFGRGRRG